MLYQKMVLIRKFENYLSSLIKKGELSGALHLCVGQEAVSVGIAANLHKKDTVTFTHRGHGHFLAKGGKSKHLLAEIFGKNSGDFRTHRVKKSEKISRRIEDRRAKSVGPTPALLARQWRKNL